MDTQSAERAYGDGSRQHSIKGEETGYKVRVTNHVFCLPEWFLSHDIVSP